MFERDVGGLSKHEEIHAKMKKTKNRTKVDSTVICDALPYVLQLGVLMDSYCFKLRHKKSTVCYISASSCRQQLHLHIQITDPWLSSRNSVSNGSLITHVN